MRRIVFTIIFLLNGLLLEAQEGYIAQAHALGIEDGLLSNVVMDVFEDSKGLIWIGTDYGLHRYDGLTVRAYSKDAHGLPGNFISTIVEDVHGKIWIKCSTQLNMVSRFCVFDPILEKAIPLSDYTSSPVGFDFENIGQLIVNKDRTIWLMTKDYKLYEYDGIQIVFLFEIDKSLGFDYLYDLQKIEDGKVSYFTQNHIYLGKNIEVEASYFLYYDYYKKQKIYDCKFSQKNSMVLFSSDSLNNFYWADWTYSGKGDLMFYSKSNASDSLEINRIQTKSSKLLKDDQQFLMEFDGFFEYYTLKGQLQKKIPLSHNLELVNVLLVDKRGGFWYIDYQAAKLRYLRYVRSPFQAYQLTDEKTSLYYRGGRDMVLVGDSTLYLGSVLEFKDKTTTKGLHIKSLGTGIGGVMKDELGNVYYSNLGRGVYVYNQSTKKHKLTYLYNENAAHHIDWTLLQDKASKVWVGTNQGLYYLDTTKHLVLPETKYNDFQELKQNTIYFILEVENILWLGTTSGLYQWDKQKGAQARYHNQGKEGRYLPHDVIAHIHKDKEGLFWLASKGGGLIKFNPKSGDYQEFTTRDGLVHNVIYAVYEDANEQLWLSSNRGIMCFNKESYLLTSYTKENGLLDDEFNTISHYQDQKGQIYFGSQKGLIIFHPEDFTKEQESFPLLVTQVAVLDGERDVYRNIIRDFKRSNTLSLRPSDKGFQLNVALLDYRNPKEHQYSYKIEAIHKNWRYQSEPNIQESNLPYGSYVLRVRVKGVTGIWVELDEPIGLVVLRPFYLQWWFVLLGIITTVFAVLLFVKWRTKSFLTRQKELELIVEKRTQKIAKQAEDLKALDKVKSRFFTNISHELRTPLTLILGPLSYLLDKPEEWEKAAVQKQLNTMYRNGKSLLQLVEEILDLSKLEAHKLELAETATPVAVFFQRIYTTFIASFESLGINHSLNLNLKKADLYLLIDRNKLEKVGNNFLSNAIKFTPKGGQVRIEVKESEDKLILEVMDNGKGVHPDDLPYIFDRFYQSKQADDALYGGTGIGLALVREFANLMGGKVHAESVLGKGSIFRFELPKKMVASTNLIDSTEEASELLEEEIIDSIGTDFTILVVEDNLDMRDFICSFLTKRYTVLQAQNGVEGLKQIESRGEEIHLVISDVMMPEMDGLTMLKHIKSDKRSQHIPVIMLTALAAERDKLNALLIGVDDYLTKPFLVNELLVRVQNLLYNYHQRKLWQNKEIDANEDSSLEVQKTDVSPNNPVLKQEKGLISKEDQEWAKAIEEKVKKSIEINLISPEELAKEFHLSQRQFGRRLKIVTGLSPAKFIKEVQLQLARYYLERGGSLSVSEVAYDTGFEVRDTFSRLYKKRFGKSPKEYL